MYLLLNLLFLHSTEVVIFGKSFVVLENVFELSVQEVNVLSQLADFEFELAVVNLLLLELSAEFVAFGF